MPPVLELRNITKQFPGVLANDHISLSLNQGEIHALLGENGAGKTTLMNILYGLYQPDEGEILVRDAPVKINSPSDAIRAGIGMVHQHFMLVPVLTVTENVMAGDEYLMGGVFLDRKRAAARLREISLQHGLEVNPDAYVKDLPVGVQQRVEIIKLLFRNAEILILDEPTSVLTPRRSKSCLGCCAHWSRKANPSSLSPTSSKKSWRWPTGSRSCATGRSLGRRFPRKQPKRNWPR